MRSGRTFLTQCIGCNAFEGEDSRRQLERAVRDLNAQTAIRNPKPQSNYV